MDKILLIGIGNYGRSDDALGWLFADHFLEFKNVFDIEYRYQLQIEDAELISGYDDVIFVDATVETLENGFQFSTCQPEINCSFTSHSLSPETVLQLTADLYNRYPTCRIMAISGYDWNLAQGISQQAQGNLEKAELYFAQLIDTILKKSLQKNM